MPLTEGQKQSIYNYAKKTLKRIPLDVRKEKYEDIKAAADSAGESVNHYIKKAIDERMERDNIAITSQATPEPTTGILPDASQASPRHADVPKAEPQPVTKSAGLPEFLTPDILARIDRAKFAHDTAYQIEIGNIIGMTHLADLAEYLKQ